MSRDHFLVAIVLQRFLPEQLEEAAEVFQLFDWWCPNKLAEATGMDSQLLKDYKALRKRHVLLEEYDPSTDHVSPINSQHLDTFASHLRGADLLALQTLLPRQIDGCDFDFIDLFAGIGGLRKPFSEIGGRCVLTCEWDNYASRTYQANWKSSEQHSFCADIKLITQPTAHEGAARADFLQQAVPNHDLLLAGFPCQPFSIAGVTKKNSLNRAHGFNCEDQGQLFFDICRILSVKQPQFAVLENVKNLKSHDGGNTFGVITETLENLSSKTSMLFKSNLKRNIQSYWIVDLNENGPDDPKVIDAKEFLPQHRERLVLVCVRKDVAKDLGLSDSLSLRLIDKPTSIPSLSDILEPNDSVDPRYTLSPRLWTYLQDYAKRHKARGNGFGYGMVTPGQTVNTRTLSARYYKDGSEILIDQSELKKDRRRGGRPRKLTPEECARLMGFSNARDNFRIPVSDTRAYQQFGNSVVVPVFRAIADLLEPSIKAARHHRA